VNQLPKIEVKKEKLKQIEQNHINVLISYIMSLKLEDFGSKEVLTEERKLVELLNEVVHIEKDYFIIIYPLYSRLT